MDGTLVDSEEFHWMSWREALAKEDVAITREQFLSSFGQRNDSVIPGWLGAATSPERIQRIGNAKEELYRQLIRERGITALPGVSDWLRRLHEQGWLQAIASSAPRPNVEVVLDALAASNAFETIVSADDVQRGKPDPEVYLTAARRLGVLPARCIVVEDAAAGILGARNAGMRSVGVSRNGKPLAADVVVRSLDRLPSDTFNQLLIL
jgi:beta-phosphoglucomutase